MTGWDGGAGVHRRWRGDGRGGLPGRQTVPVRPQLPGGPDPAFRSALLAVQPALLLDQQEHLLPGGGSGRDPIGHGHTRASRQVDSCVAELPPLGGPGLRYFMTGTVCSDSQTVRFIGA